MDVPITDQRPVDNHVLNLIPLDKVIKQKEDLNLSFSSDREEGEIVGHKGKEKTYDFDGATIPK